MGSDRWLGCRYVRASKAPFLGVGGGKCGSFCWLRVMPFVSRNKHSVFAQDRDTLLVSVETCGDLVYDRKDLDLRFSL